MKCSFCDQEDIEDIKKRIIREGDGKKWSAFVPKEPEIFGHIVVTWKGSIHRGVFYLTNKGSIHRGVF